MNILSFRAENTFDNLFRLYSFIELTNVDDQIINGYIVNKNLVTTGI